MSLVTRWRANEASKAIYDPNEMPVMWHDTGAAGYSLTFRTAADDSLSTGTPPPGWATLTNHASVFNNAGASWSQEVFYTVASATGAGAISTIICPKITTTLVGNGRRFTIELTIDGTVYTCAIDAASLGAAGRYIVGSVCPVKAPFSATATYSSAHVDKDEFRYHQNAAGPAGVQSNKCGISPPAIVIPITSDAKRLTLPYLAFRESMQVRMKSGVSITATAGDHYAAVVYEMNKFT